MSDIDDMIAERVAALDLTKTKAAGAKAALEDLAFSGEWPAKPAEPVKAAPAGPSFQAVSDALRVHGVTLSWGARQNLKALWPAE